MKLVYSRRALAAMFAPLVIAGLDPAIHHLRKTLAKRMDARVKPAHDANRSALLWPSAKLVS
jgi:hypothetical protein